MLTVLLLLAVGVAVGRARLLPDGASAVLDATVIRLALPGLILVEITTAPLGLDALTPVAVAWGSLALLAGLVLLLSRLLGLDRITTGTLLVVVPLGNTSFLGFPAVTALLGADRLALAVVYDQLGSFLALTTYATVVAAAYGHDIDGRGPLGRLVRFPPFVALLAALVLRPVGLPDVVVQVGDRLGDLVVPLAMIAIGMRLRLDTVRHRPGVLAAGLTLRMVVAPAAVVGVGVLAGIGGAAWQVSSLESAMPPMVTAAVIATDAGLDERLAVGLAGVGVVVAMVSLPLWTLVIA